MNLSPKDMPISQIKSVKYHLNWKYASIPSPSLTSKVSPPNTSTSLKAKTTPTAATVQLPTTSTIRNAGILQQIPSKNTDFKNGDNSAVKLTFVSSYKDSTGNYHVVENLQDLEKFGLQMAARVHLYDSSMNEIDNQYSYTHPDPVSAGSSAAFDVTLAQIHF